MLTVKTNKEIANKITAETGISPYYSYGDSAEFRVMGANKRILLAWAKQNGELYKNDSGKAILQ